MRRSWQLNFGVGFLMFIMLVVAGYFYGLNRGDAVRYNITRTTKTYSLSPLLSADQPVDRQLETISKLIRETIAPDTWLDRGGMATLTIYESNRSIVVHQSGSEHEKIQDLLASIEELVNEEIRSVEYDVSLVVDGTSDKPIEQQLKAICALATEDFSGPGTMPIQLTFDLESEAIIVTAGKQMHSALAAYFDQLRFARRAISQIDG